MSEKKRVLIVGGGIAGLTVAHELARRGYSVEILEKSLQKGGKSRSIPVPDSGTEGRQDLPGEHGFRFFPGFYKHLPAVLSTIPFGPSKSCADNLVDTSEVLITRMGSRGILLPSRLPRSTREAFVLLRDLLLSDFGLEDGEANFFALRIFQVMTSCERRRKEQLEKISWWDYVDAESFSPNYQRLMAEGLSRSLVAARAKEASARTIGQVQAHLFSHVLQIGGATDRVLNGPTSEMMIDPWIAEIERCGGVYRTGSEVTKIDLKHGQVVGIEVQAENGSVSTLEADYYVCALPIEALSRLVDGPLSEDPSLAALPELAQDVRWMNGVQFFLNRDEPINYGHTLHVDTPWALTSISQSQFWKDYDLSKCGNGKVRGILSVCISDWDAPNIHGKRASDCRNGQEVIDEVWVQLKKSLEHSGFGKISDDMIEATFLDPAIRFDASHSGGAPSNNEPLFVNRPDSWSKRPSVFTSFNNLFLAGDYVQTNADLACMEGACEAGRVAANAVLAVSKYDQMPCQIYRLDMPKSLRPIRWVDNMRYRLDREKSMFPPQWNFDPMQCDLPFEQ